MFAGININKTSAGYFLEEENYAKIIEQLEKSASFDKFCTTRNKIEWLVNTRPEITVGVNILCKITEKNYKE